MKREPAKATWRACRSTSVPLNSTPTSPWPMRAWEPYTPILTRIVCAEENAQKAFDLRERTSELEKFYITDHYYSNVTGELPKAIENCELWIQTYPRDWSPRNNLAAVFSNLGDSQKALPRHSRLCGCNPTTVSRTRTSWPSTVPQSTGRGQSDLQAGGREEAGRRRIPSDALHNRVPGG